MEPDDNGGVYLNMAQLAKSSVQWVERSTPGLVLRLEPGYRRHVVHPRNIALNDHWERILGENLYELTHTMAGRVELQCLAETPPVIVPGISFRSRVAPADIVYVMYDPPLVHTDWTPIGVPISLASVVGAPALWRIARWPIRGYNVGATWVN